MSKTTDNSIDYDKFFKKKKSEHYSNIKLEFADSINRAKDVPYVKSKIASKIAQRIWHLHTASEFTDSIGNHFKRELHDFIDEAFRIEKDLPVKHFIEEMIPSLRMKYKEKMKENPTKYFNKFSDGSNDGDFINSTEKEVIDFVSEYIALKEYKDVLFEVTQDELDIKKYFDEIIKSENTFLKGFTMQKVVDHFKPLTEKKSTNGKPFLTDLQLIHFIQRGFLNKNSISKQTFNLAVGEKGFIINRFYEFYNIAVGQYNEPNKKKRYINLLSDNFTNWNYQSITSFFKPKKTKRKW